MQFPENPNFRGYNRPSRLEVDVADLEVEGQVPTELNGVFHRVTPDPKFPPKMDNDIWFNGDGMVSMFHFQDGRIDFRQRYVRTDKFMLEEKAGRALFGAYRNPLTDDPSVKGVYRGTANTNAFVHGGKLFALKEDSPAVEMDPWTLETRGYTDFAGQVTSPTFTAHPKIDPETGDMCAFGYAAKGLLTKDIVYYELSPDHRLKHEVWFELPYYCMMHDFGLTEDYAVFHVVPIVGSWERLEQGLPHFGFDTTKDVYLGVLPRKGEAKDLRWFKAPNCFASHVMNAFNDGPHVYFDVPQGRNNMFPFFPDVHGAPFDREAAGARMTRWSVDMSSKADTFQGQERLSDLVGEFPRVDDRYTGRPYRNGYQLAQDFGRPVVLPGGRSASGMMMNLLGHLDHATGQTRTWWSGETTTLQEPTFAPKPGGAEGEGYLLVVANRLHENRSDLLIFEAQNVPDGPVATVRLELRLRQALHGNWTPTDQLPERQAA